ncbi:hypothetical protein NPIL_580811 [Nephila pilipes]|uniref:Uncharacterized protein n=1 Tax=Nephila pilipes TaxID=299642 RepID=A0A8X6UJM0_NEPPI|nr:hypothetical protein NPIL_580811 [Nephila pilipes]
MIEWNEWLLIIHVLRDVHAKYKKEKMYTDQKFTMITSTLVTIIKGILNICRIEFQQSWKIRAMICYNSMPPSLKPITDCINYILYDLTAILLQLPYFRS